MLRWNGSIVIWPKRILFAGEAARSDLHHSHTLMICLAFNGTLSVQVGPGASWERFAAVIIDAGTQHRIDGKEAEFVAIIHLLPDTEEAKELRQTYLTNGGASEIPYPLAGKVLASLETLKDYWLLACKTGAEFCDLIVSELITSPSTSLHRDVDYHVRRAIDELYSRMETQLRTGQSIKGFFTVSSVAAELHLDEIGWEAKDLKREFKKSTGASFDDYVKLLRYRATLVKLALNQAEMRASLKQRKVGNESKKRLMKISLTAAAKWLGWGNLSRLDHASRELLGISPSSLRTGSRFIDC